MEQINSLRDQQKAIISSLCVESRKEFLSYFFSYAKDKDKAEDMTQQLFVHLLLYKGVILPATLRSFAFQTARRIIVDDSRRMLAIVQPWLITKRNIKITWNISMHSKC